MTEGKVPLFTDQRTYKTFQSSHACVCGRKCFYTDQQHGASSFPSSLFSLKTRLQKGEQWAVGMSQGRLNLKFALEANWPTDKKQGVGPLFCSPTSLPASSLLGQPRKDRTRGLGPRPAPILSRLVSLAARAILSRLT